MIVMGVMGFLVLKEEVEVGGMMGVVVIIGGVVVMNVLWKWVCD